jgi:hypothetical protein
VARSPQATKGRAVGGVDGVVGAQAWAVAFDDARPEFR